MSSKADSGAAAGASRAGFLLTEVLVALVVAGLFLGALSRAFAFAWGAAHVPGDVMAAVTLARAALADGQMARDTGQVGAFAYVRSFGPVSLRPRPSRLAPAPLGADKATTDAKTRPEGRPLQLRSVAVTVRAPFGRRVSLETVRLDAPAN